MSGCQRYRWSSALINSLSCPISCANFPSAYWTRSYQFVAKSDYCPTVVEQYSFMHFLYYHDRHPTLPENPSVLVKIGKVKLTMSQTLASTWKVTRTKEFFFACINLNPSPHGCEPNAIPLSSLSIPILTTITAISSNSWSFHAPPYHVEQTEGHLTPRTSTTIFFC